MTKAKICFVAATPLTIHFFMRPHLAVLADMYDVTLIYNKKNDSYLPPLDIPVRQLSVDIMRKISPWHDMLTLWQLYKIFRREKFDLVTTLAPKAGLLGICAAAMAGIKKRLHIFQGEVWASRCGFMRTLLKTTDTLTACKSTHIIAMGAGEKKFLENEKVVAANRITVLGSGSIAGVDMHRFVPDAAIRADFRAARNIPADAILCLFIGRLTKDKGVFELVRAFDLCAHANPSLWLCIVGPDEDKIEPRLRALVTGSAAQRLIIEGFTKTPEKYLAAADMLCLPSYREGFSTIILEAASAGVPAIGTSIYGIVDAIRDEETGLLVPPAAIDALANALTRLTQDTALRARLAEKSRQRVGEEFEQSQVIARYVDYFRNLL